MDAYFVGVSTDFTAGERKQRRVMSWWVVCADAAEDAKRIIAQRVAAGREILTVAHAPSGTAERYHLAAGRAKHLAKPPDA